MISRKIAHKILVTGPIYNLLKLESLNNLVDNYELIVINGSLFYNLENIENKINNLNKLLNDKIIYNLSDLDYVSSTQNEKIFNFIKNKSNVVTVNFNGGSCVTIVSGGIPFNMGKEGLQSNLEISFVSRLGEGAWHEQYGGKLGYIISNNPLKDAPPDYFAYSCRLGTTAQSQKTYAQEVNQYGLQKTILL